VHDHDFDRIQPDWKPTAARYEGGSENTPGFIGLRASLELLLGYGTANLGRRVLQITELACHTLAAAGATIESVRDGGHDSGIVSFTWPHGNMRAIRRQLLNQGIVLSFRGGCLRISPHAYTSEDDIARLVAALEHPA
jgi:selenocysteine lyase/cysteine desulfurase